MKIDELDFRWEFCCYGLMDNCYMQGFNPNWAFCPFCGQTIEYIKSADTISTLTGDKDELHSV